MKSHPETITELNEAIQTLSRKSANYFTTCIVCLGVAFAGLVFLIYSFIN